MLCKGGVFLCLYRPGYRRYALGGKIAELYQHPPAIRLCLHTNLRQALGKELRLQDQMLQYLPLDPGFA